MAFWIVLLKSLHIVAVIAWMAGLLGLYRLYVQHRAEGEAVAMARFRALERWAWLAVAVPGAWGTVLTGAAIIALLPCGYLPQGWLTLKLILVAGLLAVHLLAGRTRKAFLEPPFPASEAVFRALTVVPAVVTVLAVLLVEFQPPWFAWPGC